MSFAKESWPFVLPVAAGGGLLLAVGWSGVAFVCLLLAAGLLLFFRIPRRRFVGGDDVLLAPASGRVTAIDIISDAALGAQPVRRVVTFLSVFDVHVQRAPATASVLSSTLQPGRKIAAFKPAAGEVNESRMTVLRLASGETIGVRQIAGLVARRVVGYLDEGDAVERGELIGLIKFGSRVDLLVPESYDILVHVGERVSDGLTPMAVPSGRRGNVE